jgi:hypothetical protein
MNSSKRFTTLATTVDAALFFGWGSILAHVALRFKRSDAVPLKDRARLVAGELHGHMLRHPSPPDPTRNRKASASSERLWRCAQVGGGVHN